MKRYGSIEKQDNGLIPQSTSVFNECGGLRVVCPFTIHNRKRPGVITDDDPGMLKSRDS
jgi:hypothetical protein